MLRKLSLAIIASLMLFAAFPIASAQLQMADSFGVNDASGAQGTNVLVPVNIVNTKNGPIQTVCFNILYNHSVIDLVSLKPGNLTSVAGGWMHTLGLNHESITIATFQSANAIPNGSTDSVVFLNFSVIGGPGETSNMNISNLDMSNVGLQHGIAPVINGTFTIEDILPPEIMNVQAIPDSQIVGGWVNISCTVTDNVDVDTVMVNITGPAGFTPVNVSMNEGSGYYYNDTYTVVGTYNYFIWANDTSGNENTSTTYTFTIQDTTLPTITDNTPTSATTGDPFTFNATVTDNIGVSHVCVYYWFGTETATNVSMIATGIDDYYEYTIIIPSNSIAILHYNISAVDDAGNWNQTGQKDVPVTDNDAPEISNVNAEPDPQEVNGYVNITCDVTDNVAVDEVWVNITYPDSTTHNFSMNPGSYYFNQTYSILGTYNYLLWANDTSGNWNTSIGYSFVIRDTTPPEITDVEATPDPQEVNGYVNITCTVTDNVAVDAVKVNITYPASGINATMTKILGTNDYYYNATYSIIGLYSYFIWANDINGNVNISATYNFTIGNRPPNTPSIPSGPTSGYAGISYSYSTTTTDPDNDMVQYRFDWGDGNISDWTSFVPSGTSGSASHSWNSIGSYDVKAQARDENNATSGWSDPLTVTILNHIPVLSSGEVNPTSGNVTTIFTYSVNYTDADNQQPSFINVIIDGIPHAMSVKPGQDGDYMNGEIYEYSTTLSSGSSHTFRFETNDEIDDAIGDTGIHDGPLVTGISAPPDVSIIQQNVTDDPASDPETYNTTNMPPGVTLENAKGFYINATGPDGSYIFNITFLTSIPSGFVLYKLPEWKEISYIIIGPSTIQVQLNISGGVIDPAFVLAGISKPAAVPTLTILGMIALIGSLAFLAVIIIKKKRKA